MLLNSYFSVQGPTRGACLQTVRYRVQFRKDRDGTVVAFENCGCEADANTFRPCRMHQGNVHQATRLEAEARYHSIHLG